MNSSHKKNFPSFFFSFLAFGSVVQSGLLRSRFRPFYSFCLPFVFNTLILLGFDSVVRSSCEVGFVHFLFYFIFLFFYFIFFFLKKKKFFFKVFDYPRLGIGSEFKSILYMKVHKFLMN